MNTIEKSSLNELWLPCEKKERESLEYMEKACQKAYGKPRFQPLHEARMAVLFRWDETIESIRKRGGLLLIVGA